MNKVRNINRLFLGMVIFAFLFSMGAGLLLRSYSVEMGMILGQLMFLIPVVFYVIVMRVPVKNELPYRKIKISTAFMVILFTILMMPLVSFLNIFSMLFVQNHVSEISFELGNDSFFINLLLVAIIPAISEEFMFRGVFYGTYRKKNHIRGALMCGLVFGMAHMNLNQFLYAFVLGFTFCLLMEATGSILAPMLAHFLINGWSVILIKLQELLDHFLPAAEESTQAAALTTGDLLAMLQTLAVTALVSTVLAGCVLYWISRHCNRDIHFRKIFSNAFVREKKEEQPCYDESGRLLECPAQNAGNRRFITPCLVVGVVFCVIQMILVG